MKPDSIVEEVRQARRAYMEECNNDLQALYEDLKRQEEQSQRTYYAFAPKPSPFQLTGTSSSQQ
ncbi:MULTISPECIES: hypothetical protein [Roseofilum]|uniref:Uncharacterized protein n=2 Tax=Roseofilum TaxID=1233426 RepID=A0ABT7B0V6_9CYAN|nr:MULTISPECIES: hypothetical protein [Roseofilum]MDJ1170436.1 hypothetical protein [Roseofilum acuticapitatum BLCC-M154]MDJ1172800.1 hypothetical protein [Roseofilum capinflatum BLCC-M114]